MKRATGNDETRPIALRRYLGARLLPLSVLVVVAVSITAPLVFLDFRMRELRAQAEGTGRRVAELVGAEAAVRPLLWRYDTLKLVEHVGHERGADVERIEIVGSDGRQLGLGTGVELERLASLDVLWGTVPLVVDGQRVGDVWVAVSATRARRAALLLLVPFSVLGLLLAALIYGIPLRAAGRAERHIRELVTELDRSRRALASRGDDLEREVLARSSELSAAYAELQRKEAHLRALSSRAVALEEDERRAIARELHDSAGQALTAIRIHLQLIGEAVPEASPMRALALQTVAMTDDTLEEIRRAVRMLGPAILGEIGLARALERYCDDFAERSRAAVTCTLELGDAPLSAGVESACYRIAQEALTNITKHASAAHVTVRLTRDVAHVTLEITDDGCGFTPDPSHDGRGLTGMRERVELLGGLFTVRGAPGKGTLVRAEIPL